MKRLTTLKDKILYRIRKSKENTFLVKDFLDLSDRDQILRVLRTLMNNKELIRVGKGVYTKARQSALTGDYIPKDNLRNIALTALNKLGVKILSTPEEIAYNNIGKVSSVKDGNGNITTYEYDKLGNCVNID